MVGYATRSDLLTGSSQFHLIKSMTESLAERIGLLSLLPYQFAEMPSGLRVPSIYQGAYPELVSKKYALAADWYSSYL